jgi:hypothetical protein
LTRLLDQVLGHLAVAVLLLVLVAAALVAASRRP